MADHDREPPRTPAQNTDHSWSPDDKITEDEIEEAFEQCPHCGRYIVRNTNAHYCDPAEYRPNPNEEECNRRIEANPFPDDDPVLVREHQTRNTYAYHEPDSDDTPLCPASADQSFVTLARKQAHEQRLVPCRRCQRIRDTGEDGR
ncbi:hypothetical protein [Haladaptatus halobius]|uniref:hypothetical protein n=1 Tax=Haladaptatus halobius TaxID=2884875 RepID=UPI001D0A0CCF|nr:hypothetical protein [Haladaptatus halobius]